MEAVVQHQQAACTIQPQNCRHHLSRPSDGIAFQTNILALNAAVETARAGTGARVCRGGVEVRSPGGTVRIGRAPKSRH
ncbi:MAG: hypothetical protein IPH37_07495 [Burkholderiales bacterium]|nr:hypothetical protein [Burkholderiales bacterium]